MIGRMGCHAPGADLAGSLRAREGHRGPVLVGFGSFTQRVGLQTNLQEHPKSAVFLGTSPGQQLICMVFWGRLLLTFVVS